jgi:hypothetical protein
MIQKNGLILFIVISTILISCIYLFHDFSFDKGEDPVIGDVKHISMDIGSRPAGSVKERETADYLKSRFEDYSIDTDIQDFKYYRQDKDKFKSSCNVIPGVSTKDCLNIIIHHTSCTILSMNQSTKS